MIHRDIALEKFPHYCVCCGFGLPLLLRKQKVRKGKTSWFWKKDTPLEVHHFDNADKKNNRPSNLVYLCNRCHRLQGLGLIKNSEIKQKKILMMKKSKNSITFQKYRKKLTTDDLRRWSENKEWKGNWKGIHKDARDKATATIKKQKRSVAAKRAARTRKRKSQK